MLLRLSKKAASTCTIHAPHVWTHCMPCHVRHMQMSRSTSYESIVTAEHSYLALPALKAVHILLQN